MIFFFLVHIKCNSSEYISTIIIPILTFILFTTAQKNIKRNSIILFKYNIIIIILYRHCPAPAPLLYTYVRRECLHN